MHLIEKRGVAHKYIYYIPSEEGMASVSRFVHPKKRKKDTNICYSHQKEIELAGQCLNLTHVLRLLSRTGTLDWGIVSAVLIVSLGRFLAVTQTNR